MNEFSDINNLLETLKNFKDENEAKTFLANRGSNCFKQSMFAKIKELRENLKNEDEILNYLKKNFPLLKEIEGKFYMVYPRCFCHNLENVDIIVPKSYCYCTEGCVREFFKTALSREVNVQLEKSVRWGDEVCKIRVDL